MALRFQKMLLATAVAALALACNVGSVSPDETGVDGLSAGDGSESTESAETSAPSEPTDGDVRLKGFREHWEDGTTCATTPKVEVGKYGPGTYIFRQSLCTNFEAPFLYLLLGKKRALMLDTGTGHADVRAPVEAAMKEWMTANGLKTLPLVVAHTHSHSDHVKGDSQLRSRPNTTVVGLQATQVATFFGLTAWPQGLAAFDLGGRIVDVTPLPGHESAHIAVYDRQEQILFTGDTLYPGRLYIQNWSAFRTSVHRLVQFVADRQLPVRWVLGAHIEMSTTPGKDYPFEASKHLQEHPMQQPYARLLELDAAAQAMITPRLDRHPDFIIYP